jgi:hypothetical protein
MSCANSLCLECLGDLDRGERPDGPVVVAPVGHAVDVRSEHDRFERLGAGTRTEDVPREVHAHRESGVAHPSHDVGASRAIRVAERDP